jgi:hypothetical protein
MTFQNNLFSKQIFFHSEKFPLLPCKIVSLMISILLQKMKKSRKEFDQRALKSFAESFKKK